MSRLKRVLAGLLRSVTLGLVVLVPVEVTAEERREVNESRALPASRVLEDGAKRAREVAPKAASHDEPLATTPSRYADVMQSPSMRRHLASLRRRGYRR